jgi:hypothetical protein
MIDRNSLSIEEWGDVISVPASIGALVVTADPSGPMGLIKEFRAIMDSIKSYVEQHSASSPLMSAIHTYLTTKPTDEEEADLKRWAEEQQEEMKANRPQSPEEMKTLVRERTSEVLAMLRSKGATEEDVSLFKRLMYTVAEGVANASKEGGFLGFGGTRVSDAEQSVLAQIKTELGV